MNRIRNSSKMIMRIYKIFKQTRLDSYKFYLFTKVNKFKAINQN